jgi:LacI family transcriptional regulator
MEKYSSSLREIARLAGVSLGTASRALNNKDNVLPETRARVLRVAAELGYKRQFRAPSAVTAKLNNVGVVVKRDPGDFPRIDVFNYAILTGIEDECQTLGLNLLYASIQVDEFGHAIAWPNMFKNESIDGLLIVGAFFEKTLLSIHDKLTVPIVLVDAYAPGFDLDAVLTDNVAGARRAVEYLIENGHRHIGLIGSHAEVNQHVSIQERRIGYLQALREAGIDDVYIENSLLDANIAYKAVQNLLSHSPQVSAIFACNDDVASGVVRGAQDMGRRVPEDLSVIGFDDTEQAVQSTPQLTTMRVHASLMGSVAVRQLFDQVARDRQVHMTVHLGTKLIVRDSVRTLSDPPASRKRDRRKTLQNS